MTKHISENLREEGYSASYIQKPHISKESDISIRAINKIYSQTKKQENRINKKEQRGKPRSLTEEQEKKIRLAVVKNKRLSSREIQKSKALNSNNVCQITINTSLIRQGLVSRISPTVPKISEKNISQRADWAYGMLGMSSDEINNFIFTDERKKLSSSDKRKKYTFKILQIDSIIQWWSRTDGMGRHRLEGGLKLIWIDDRLNILKYKELLENNLISTGLLDDRTLKHDKSAVHQSNLVKSYLNDEGIDVLHWPAQSPDMNQIENVWAFVRNKLEKKKENIKNQDQLWQYATKVFFPSEYTELIQNIIDELIKKEGRNTKY